MLLGASDVSCDDAKAIVIDRYVKEREASSHKAPLETMIL